MTTMLIEETFSVFDDAECETDSHLLILYDGASYYVGITDDFVVSDSCTNESDIAIFPSSRAYLLDAAGYDLTTTLAEDAEYFIYRHDATSVDHFSDAKKITYDDNGNLFCISEKFFWSISKTNASINYYKFLYPNLEGIIDAQYYNNAIYVLQYIKVPTEIYEICSDTLAITDSVTLRNQENTEFYMTFFYYPPAMQYRKQKIQEYYLIRLSKYNLNGEEEIHFDYQVGNNTQLIAPVQFDIFNDLLYIVDQGDSKIKILTLDGIFVRSISSRHFNIPLQVAVEDADYIWVLDSTVSPYYGYKFRIKKIDLRDDSLYREEPYKNKPFMSLVRSVSAYDMHVIEKPDSSPYKYYKNFVYTHNITMALDIHNILELVVYKGEYLFALSSNPIEASILNLSTASIKFIRECKAPITVGGLEPFDTGVLVSDTGLYNIGSFYLYGRKDSVLIDSILPKGITKVEGSYFITDIRYSSVYKVQGNTITKIYTDLVRPTDITTDGVFLFIVDTGGNVIKKLDTDGNLLLTIGGPGEQVGKFNYPLCATIDNNILFVLDHGNFRIQKFTLDGEFISQIVLSPPVEFEYLDAVDTYTSIEEAIEYDNGGVVIQKTGNYSWGDYVGENTIFFGTKFFVTLPISCIINSANISFPNVSTARIGNATFGIETRAENDLTPTPYDETAYYDLSNRYVIEDFSSISFGASNLGNIKTGELKSLITTLHSSDYWTNKTYLSFIHKNTTPSYITYYIPIHRPVLTVNYTRVIYKRRNGFFYYMSIDQQFIYVSDIAENKIKVYNKTTGAFVEEFDFEGTIFKQLTDEIFITDKNCAISYINKFEWNREEEYTIEFTEEQGDLFRFYFTVDWEVAFSEPYEKIYEVGMLEDFEWFVGIDYALAIEEENELLVPEISWVI